MNYPTNRQEAKATGATHYYTGVPCKHGHIALRKTKGACVECIKIEWQESNAARALLPKSEASKEAGKRYYERNKALVIARAQAFVEKVSKAVLATDNHGGQTVFPSISALREALGIKPPTINRALKSGNIITRGKYTGWSFKYS